jgi:hypothetical protein
LSGCGRGDGCWSHPDHEHSKKKKVRYLTILKTICPVQENVNVVRQEMKTLTNDAGIGFKKQLAEE